MPRHAELSLRHAPLPAWAVAALIHAACSFAIWMLVVRAPGLAPDAAWSWYWLEGLSAAVLGAVAGLPVWWLPINLVFAPAAHAVLGWHIPAVAYLAAFCLLFACNAGAWRHRVPLFLSSAKVTAALSALLPSRAGLRFLDLGCGTGSVLSDLARARPDGSYHGIETAPLTYGLSWWRTRRCAAVRVTWGDFWDVDFSHYDVVYAYLSPEPMARLWEKARREMKPGSLLVSNTFVIPGVVPAYALPAGDRMRSTLLVWRM